MVASLCGFNPFLPVETTRCTHLSFAVRPTSLPSITTYDGEKNVERRSTTSDMCTSPLETTFNYHIPRNFYPSGDIFYYSETENKYRIKRKLLKWI